VTSEAGSASGWMGSTLGSWGCPELVGSALAVVGCGCVAGVVWVGAAGTVAALLGRAVGLALGASLGVALEALASGDALELGDSLVEAAWA